MTAVHERSSREAKTWPWVAAAIVVVIALFAPVLWLPGTSAPRAEAVALEYESALLGLRDGLAESQHTLVLLTDPKAESRAFPDLLPTLFRFQAAIRVARDRAAASLPHAWPLAPSKPFDALQPGREALARAAGEADELLSHFVDVLDYRAAVDEILVIDALPLVPPSEFERFKARLADLVEQQSALLDEIPRIGLMGAHASQVRTAVRRLDAWADEYADALWIGETPKAAALIEELRSTRASLAATLSAELSAVRTDVGATIRGLAEDVERALAVMEIERSID